jgi:hypothetical protein
MVMARQVLSGNAGRGRKGALRLRQRRPHDALEVHAVKRYALNCRLRLTAWERSPQAAASIWVLLDPEEAQRSRPSGRALDLGCGRATTPAS